MRVTSKGQVTIPKDIRRRTGIQPGTEVEFTDKGREIILRKSTGAQEGDRRNDEDFRAYLDRVTGTVDLGMSTDEFMQLLRGE
jgi:AbrB family looped-hinge helix DNA binding protein